MDERVCCIRHRASKFTSNKLYPYGPYHRILVLLCSFQPHPWLAFVVHSFNTINDIKWFNKSRPINGGKHCATNRENLQLKDKPSSIVFLACLIFGSTPRKGGMCCQQHEVTFHNHLSLTRSLGDVLSSTSHWAQCVQASVRAWTVAMSFLASTVTAQFSRPWEIIHGSMCCQVPFLSSQSHKIHTTLSMEDLNIEGHTSWNYKVCFGIFQLVLKS